MKISEDMFAAIPDMVAAGVTRDQIATMYEVTTNTLQVLCSRRGISLRKPPERKRVCHKRRLYINRVLSVSLSDNVLASLEEAANMFGKAGPAQLASALLEKISTDRLYLAVLDEEV